jgi:hypothetical protein
MVVVNKLKAIIIAMIQIQPSDLKPEDVSLWNAMYKILTVVEALDFIHLIFDILSTNALPAELSNRSSIYYEGLIRILRNRYLPSHLGIYSHSADLAPTDRQTRVMACLKAIYMTAGHFECNSARLQPFESTARSLVALRHDDTPFIAHYARCTIIRLACHLQCDIVHDVDNAKYAYLTLCALHVLDDLDATSKLDLQNQLLLWYTDSDFDSTRPSRNIRDLWGHADEQLFGYKSLVSEKDLHRFAQFRLYTTGGEITSECPFSKKVVLSQGHVGVLVAFLGWIGTSSLPDDVLEITQDTLQLITRNLTARFSSHDAQELLVELVGTVTQALHVDLVLRTTRHSTDARVSTERVTRVIGDLRGDGVQRKSMNSNAETVHPEPEDSIIKIIQALFGVLGTIADPMCIGGAKEIVQAVISDSLAPVATREAATNALRNVGL